MPSAPDVTTFDLRIRKSPYFPATQRWGAAAYSVYNHMYIPRSFGDPVRNFWNLVERAILCDVAVERQVEITGPDAAAFTQLLTPRNLSKVSVGQCKYVFLTNQHGGVINDPILLRLGDNHFWLSLADSDVLLWAQGLAAYAGMNVTVREPDVSPLQLQGPRSLDIMKTVFGEDIEDLRYFWLRETELDGIPLVISRTGWSSERGYEIYLRDGSRGEELWERLMAAGEPFGLAPGHTCTIRRIEGAMLSYQADMDLRTNPYELGMDRLVDLEMDAPFVGKEALRRIRDAGAARKLVGLELAGGALPTPNTEPWPVMDGQKRVGCVTSAVHSPRLGKNIALALVATEHSAEGTRFTVSDGEQTRDATVVPKPFFDPKKTRATG